MGLINLQTNLKGLGFGKDRKGGGSSNQPYVTKDIPSNSDELDNPLKYGTGGPDMLLRGGLLTPLKVVDDVVRFGKFFIDFKSPRGLIFIAQQNLLSRLAVKTEASWGAAYGGGRLGFESNEVVATGPVNEGIYLPTSTLLQIAGNAFGVHLNKQGIDPTGLLGGLAIKNYYDVIKRQLLPPGGADPNERIQINRLYKLLQGKILKSDDFPDLYSYGGGPGSILGIGKTNIKIVDGFQRTGNNNINLKNGYFQDNFLLNTVKLTELREEKQAKYKGVYSDDTFRKDYLQYLNSLESSINGTTTSETTTNVGGYTPGLGKPTEDVFLVEQSYLVGPQARDLDTDLGQATVPEGGKAKNPLQFREFGITAEKPKAGDRSAYLRNVFRNLEADTYWAENKRFIQNPDIIDFYISFFKGSQQDFFYFPAYIENFNDGFTADWKSEKFMGRGENFYTYNGFDRSISLSFKTYARNLKVMPLMYSNLNVIASSLAPKYNSGGFMTGNLSKITLGEYIKDLPGVITSFKFSKIVSTEINWDVDAQLPYMFDISMDFKPIHDFLPKFGTTFFGGDYDFDEHPMALRLKRLRDQEDPITPIDPITRIPVSPLPPRSLASAPSTPSISVRTLPVDL